MRKIYSRTTWALMVLSACIMTPVVFVVFVCAYPFDRKRKLVHLLSIVWGLHYYWINPLWRIEYTCSAEIDPNQAYIMVSNHQSMFDICSMYKVPLFFKWVSKVEALRIPFVGALLKMHGDILISRGDQQSTRKMLKDAANWLSMGCSVCIFPEGTRSKDGRIQDFKEGAFLIARQNKLPILPIVTDGNIDIFSPNSSQLGGATVVKMHVLPAIPPDTVCSLKIKDLSKLLHTVMLEEHKKMAPQRYEG